MTSLTAKFIPYLATLAIGCQLLLITPDLKAATPANPQHWMADISNQIAKVPIKGIAMPGSHDAAMWDPSYGPNAPFPPSFPLNVIDGFEVTQSGDFSYQLAHGVRWFDVRVRNLQNETCSNAEPASVEMVFSKHTGLYLYGHGDVCTHELLTDALSQVATFVQQNPKEIVIVFLSGAGYTPAHEQALQSTLLDQNGTSLVYDKRTACTLAGSDYTPPSTCDDPTLLPQDVTPETLWKTPARVIVIDGTNSSNSNLAWTANSVQTIEGWNDPTSGTGDVNILLSFLDYGTQGSPNLPGLFFQRPAYASYPFASTLFVSQAALTPLAHGELAFVGYPVSFPAFGAYGLLPMLTQARTFNPILQQILQGTQTPASLPAPGNFENTRVTEVQSYGWFPYAVNVVELDFPDIVAAQAVIAFNDEQWGEIPREANGASAVAAGPDGSVYKLDGVGVSGTDPALYRWNSSASAWIPVILTGFEVATGVRVAVDPSGNPWVVSSRGQISKQVSAGQWTTVPGMLSATDIAIGYNGQAWAIGQDRRIYKYDASQSKWNLFPISAGKVPFHIAADAQGNLLLVNTDGTLERYSGTSAPVTFNQPFAATSVAFGGSQIWATSAEARGVTGVWSKSTTGSNWVRHRNSGMDLAVDSSSQPWLIRGTGNLMIGKLR